MVTSGGNSEVPHPHLVQVEGTASTAVDMIMATRPASSGGEQVWAGVVLAGAPGADASIPTPARTTGHSSSLRLDHLVAFPKAGVPRLGPQRPSLFFPPLSGSGSISATRVRQHARRALPRVVGVPLPDDGDHSSSSGEVESWERFSEDSSPRNVDRGDLFPAPVAVPAAKNHPLPDSGPLATGTALPVFRRPTPEQFLNGQSPTSSQGSYPTGRNYRASLLRTRDIESQWERDSMRTFSRSWKPGENVGVVLPRRAWETSPEEVVPRGRFADACEDIQCLLISCVCNPNAMLLLCLLFLMAMGAAMGGSGPPP